MRTTLTIDDELYARLEQRARAERVSVREVIEAHLRAALDAGPSRPPYNVPVHHSALVPGIDPRRLHQLAEELDDDEAIARLRR